MHSEKRKDKMQLVLVYLFFVSMYTCSTSAQEVMKVGAILDLATLEGNQSRTFLDLAALDANSRLFNGTSRVLNLTAVDCSQGLDIFRENLIGVVVGCHGLSSAIGPMAEALQIPLMVLSSRHNGEYTHYTAEEPQEEDIGGIRAMFTQFQWKQAIAIVEDGNTWMEDLLRLEDDLWNDTSEPDSLFPNQASISKTVLVANGDGVAKLRGVLSELKDRYERVFILHASPTMAMDVLKAANEVGLMGEGYSWMVTDPLASSLELVNPSTRMLASGIVGIRKRIKDSPFMLDVFHRFRTRIGEITSTFRKMSAARAYGALWVLAEAVNQLLTDSNSQNFGSDLIQKIRALNLNGANNTRFIIREQHEFEIVNVVGTSVRRIGYWNRERGIHYSKNINENSSKKIIGAVVWPGDTVEVPSTYAPIPMGVVPRIVFHQFVGYGVNNRSVVGFSMDMFALAISQLPYKLPFVYEPHNPVLLPSSPSSAHYDSLIEYAISHPRKAYGGVGDITILASRAKKVTFTQPYTKTGLVMMVRRREKKSSAFAFLDPFSPSLWTVVGVFFVVTTILIWFAERDRQLQEQSNRSARVRKVTKQVVASVSYSFSAIAAFHREKVSSSLAGWVVMWWLLMGLVIVNSYTARLSSILTTKKLTAQFTSMDNLHSTPYRVGYMSGSFVGGFLTDQLNINGSNMVPLTTPNEYVTCINSTTHRVDVIVDEMPYIDVVNSFYGDCNKYAVVDNGYYSAGGFGFFFQKGSPFASDVSTAVLSVMERNYTVVSAVANRWLGGASLCSYQAEVFDTSSDNKIDVSHLALLWIVIAVVYFICVTFTLVKRYGNCGQHQHENGSVPVHVPGPGPGSVSVSVGMGRTTSQLEADKVDVLDAHSDYFSDFSEINLDDDDDETNTSDSHSN